MGPDAALPEALAQGRPGAALSAEGARRHRSLQRSGVAFGAAPGGAGRRSQPLPGSS